jgi:ankyrin repeat protein
MVTSDNALVCIPTTKEISELIRKNGSDLENMRINKADALTQAASGGHGALVQPGFDKEGDIAVKDDTAWTPLHSAASSGREAIVRLLLQKGAELECKGKGHGGTPLSWATVRGHETVVKLLLEKKA